jgi:hypothetical protein
MSKAPSSAMTSQSWSGVAVIGGGRTGATSTRVSPVNSISSKSGLSMVVICADAGTTSRSADSSTDVGIRQTLSSQAW